MVAQLVEQETFNFEVEGSSPSRPTTTTSNRRKNERLGNGVHEQPDGSHREDGGERR